MTKQNNILINDFKLFDEGFLQTCALVASSMGVEGKLAILDNNDKAATVSKDGISIAKNTRFANKTMNFGCLKAIEGCGLTLARSGDSTTLTSVLMASYLNNFKRRNFNKAVERGMYKAIEEVYSYLEKLSKRATKKQLREIVKVACNNDAELTSVIVDAYEYAGKEGILEVILKPDSVTTEFVKQDGMRLEGHGYSSEHFVNQETKNFCFEGQNVAVLCSSTVEYTQTIIDQIQNFYKTNPRSAPLTLFLEKPNPIMLDKMIGIKQVNFNVNLVYVNEYSEYESETLLQDIADFTGSSVYNPRNLDSKIIFGIADKLTSTLDSTVILVDEVPLAYRESLEKLKNSDKKDQKRIKRLTPKSSVINVGGISPSKAKETFDRCEDAVFSLKTSQKEGVIPGGGATLVFISGLMNTKLSNKEEQQGYNLVKKCMPSAFLQILKNGNRRTAKWYEPWKVDYITPALQNFGTGYNASSDTISDLVEDGIIDSKMSIRVAIESSLEIAVQMFNIGSIVHWPEKQSLD